ncbi:hypothetical protein C8F04DRAFT_1387675 [Mycena alexandri]|uniref:Tyrosine-protein kinase ephrin type A/B receptor-like domain-containing protein n=1 Tax=Mycena alexandri TaxID=1745969 RepID=A0AAD6XGH3_9AGAR|nr:hypothetical protein C8F04DRAFT_1387675 [Mycena alexandri]
MVFVAPFVSAALMLVCVNALPQTEGRALTKRIAVTTCNPGSYYSTAMVCVVCPAGSTCDGKSGKAQPCPPGSYQPSKNSTSCVPSPVGYYTNQAGAIQAIACAPGSYEPVTNSSSCLIAPAGYYTSQKAATAPIACPTGSYQPSRNSTACIGTPAGSYTNQRGSNQATPCPAGSYQPNKGSTSCISTTTGYFTNVTGSTSAVASPPGHFTNTNGAHNATPCPPGSYQPYSAQNFCYGAPSGRFQGMAGQANVCGTCCGWAAPLVNNNVNPVNCTGARPNANPSSGDGCISAATSCVHAKTCVQSANGTCPADTFTG